MAGTSVRGQLQLPFLMRIALFGASFFAMFFSLGQRPLRTWDESIYAGIASEMSSWQSWLTPQWNFQPWFEKPPLFMWLTALIYHLFGISELSARTVGALFGVATILLTFEIGRRLMDDWSGFTAAAILLSNFYFIFIARFGSIDAPLALLLTLAAYAYLRVREGEPRWWYLAGVATGLSIMLKGAGGLLVPLSLFLGLVLDRKLSELLSRQLLRSALVALIIALPWHLAMLSLHGRAFLNEYFGYHVIARIIQANGVEGHSGSAFYYLASYWQNMLPFAAAALLGFLLHLKGKDKFTIVIAAVIVITLLFSVVRTKLMAYTIPAYPFLSLLAASALSRLRKWKYAAPICVAILFTLYLCAEWKGGLFEYNYADTLAWDSINSKQEPLMKLLLRARVPDSSAQPEPLILDLDGYLLQKQQSVFYANRPIIQACLDESLCTNPEGHVHARYEALTPLRTVVTARPTPIIMRQDLYRKLESSDHYNVEVVATESPLVLGSISLRPAAQH
jgi:4-amino-4-deoxy-L-arabinose transferase-like glycosyltransferase